MFHAVSLDGDSELSKGLAFSAPLLRAGVARMEGAELEFAAVVEPIAEIRGENEDRIAQYEFGRDTMQDAGILVVTTNDLPRYAEAARIALRV